MKLFFLKAWRDLRWKKTRSIPIIIVIIIGGMTSSMYSNLYFSLAEILDASWEKHHYHNLLVTTKPSEVRNLTTAVNEAISNTNFDLSFEVRAFYQVQVEFSGTWTTAHLYGINGSRKLEVDQLYYHSGLTNTLYGSEEENVVVVEKLNAEKNNWILGGLLTIQTSENNSFQLETIDYVDSPEYAVKPGPATEFFGMWAGPVLWMKYPTLETLTINELTANQISCYFENPSQKNDFLEALLTTIGVDNVLNIEGRNFYLEVASAELLGMGLLLSVIFVGIAAIMLFIVLKRIVEEEYATLGLFKSLGFTSREILTSSLMYSLIISVIGGALGALSGFIVGISTGDYYIELIGVKVLPTVQTLTSGIFIPTFTYFFLTISITTIGSLFACRKVIKLQPVEAMRPKAKFKPGKKIIFERLASLVAPLSPLTKFSIRSLFQEKRKSTFVLIGIFLATFISLFGSTVVYGYITSVDKQFNYYQVWDNQIIFDNYYNSTEITSILQRDNLIDSINIYEPVILLPVRFSQEKTKIYTITGLQPSTVMRQFDRAIIVENKLIITKDLAIKYNLKRNSSITFDIYGVEKNLEVSDIINEFSGSGIYCSINTARFIADISSSDLSNALYIQSSNPDLIEETLSDD
ncbi:MAG: ABC transporter permease, partial [Candidatus Hodarchaeota archaeon]